MPTYALGDAPEDYKGDVRKPFTLIPEGEILAAKIVEIKEDVKPFTNDDGSPVVKLAWTFQTEYDNQERKVWGETGTDFVVHPDCKVYSWTQEALGTELPKGFVLNTDHLIGLPVRVVMGQRTYTKKNETTPRTVNFVADLMRAKGATTAAAPAAAAVPADESPF